MTTRALLLTTTVVSFTAVALAQPVARDAAQPRRAPAASTPQAQAPPPPPPPSPPPPGGNPRARTIAGQPINIKVEFTISDQRAGSAPAKRTVSVVVADAHTGSIRSQSSVLGFGDNVPLNVDTSPELIADGKIRLGFNLQYDSPTSVESPDRSPRGTVLKTSMHDSVSLILENGKPVIAAQSADPISDRQVTVEVKATILK